jgi:hypothetical protein
MQYNKALKNTSVSWIDNNGKQYFGLIVQTQNNKALIKLHNCATQWVLIDRLKETKTVMNENKLNIITGMRVKWFCQSASMTLYGVVESIEKNLSRIRRPDGTFRWVRCEILEKAN